MKFKIGNSEFAVNIATSLALGTEVSTRITEGRGSALATLTMDHLVILSFGPGFRAAYQSQDLVVAGGREIVWLSRLARQSVDLLKGSDLIVPLVELAERNGYPVAFVGHRGASLQSGTVALRAAVPGLRVTCITAPPLGFDPEGPSADAILREVADSGARICFIALGSPKQECFAARGRNVVPGIGFVSIGAGLDFVSGRRVHPPLWIRRLALEWLWHLLVQPSGTFICYLHGVRILPRHVLGAIKQRIKSGSETTK